MHLKATTLDRKAQICEEKVKHRHRVGVGSGIRQQFSWSRPVKRENDGMNLNAWERWEGEDVDEE